MTLKAGNPYLMPEKVHSLEVGYQWKNGGTIILGSLYYRYVTDKLTTVTRYVDNNVLLTTTENLDNSMAAGAEVIVDAEVGKWLTFNFSGNLFYNRIDASRLGYGKRMDALAWSASLNAGIVPFRNFLLQLNSRNLSFTATLSDVFNTSRTVYTIDTPQLRQRLEQRSDTRVLYFGVQWNFGTAGRRF